MHMRHVVLCAVTVISAVTAIPASAWTPRPTPRPRATARVTPRPTATATPQVTATPTPMSTSSSAPTPPRVSVNPGVSGCVDQPTPCRLYWPAVPGASAYNVYAGGTAPIATITDTQYYSTMFGRGFWVTARAGSLESARSNTVLCSAYVADCIPCSTYPAWSPSVLYSAGANVSHSLHVWRAQAATVNEEPGAAPVWVLVGRCA